MKRVTAFVGSARGQHTLQSVQRFLDDLHALGDVETEIVRLSDCRIETCKGCKRCFVEGEEHCPYAGDDRARGSSARSSPASWCRASTAAGRS